LDIAEMNSFMFDKLFIITPESRILNWLIVM